MSIRKPNRICKECGKECFGLNYCKECFIKSGGSPGKVSRWRREIKKKRETKGG